MALNYTGVTYTGETATEFYREFLQEAKSLALLETRYNVKDKMNMPTLALSNLFGEESCTFVSPGDIEVSSRQLVVSNVPIRLEVCHSDLENWWMSAKLPAGANNNDLPAQFNAVIMDEIKKNFGIALDKLIWKGDTASGTVALAYFDGLEKLWAADGSITDVVGTTLSPTNILTEIDKIIASVATNKPVMLERLQDDRVGIALSPTAFQFFIQAMNANMANGTGYEIPANGIPNRNGFKLYQVPGISTNKMAFADFRRVFFGTDLASDMEDIRVLNLYETTGDEKIRIFGKVKAGVQYMFASEIVYYS